MKFQYWKPGGHTGEVEAETMFAAAQQVLQDFRVTYVGGDACGWFAANYTDDYGNSCKLWKCSEEDQK